MVENIDNHNHNHIHNHHQGIRNKLNGFYASNRIPHIIFHGSAGTGKRTLVYDFLNTIYGGDKHKLKTNVMIVNCAHGKGIKFIRDELKFFAKSNLQANNGRLFKSIVLLNADSLTIDAQSALRRCIELFSHTTRFFIVVENKDKLLNPICSRFCEIYVPEYIDAAGRIRNLHTVNIGASMNIFGMTFPPQIVAKIAGIRKDARDIHKQFVEITEELYNGGFSTLDLIEHIKNINNNMSVNSNERWTETEIINTVMYFEKVKMEYRSEKLLMFTVLDYLFFR
jgi:hypothetical protein